MKTYHDCIPCLIKQAIEAIRMVSDDEKVQDEVIKTTLQEISRMDLNESPPYMARIIHNYVKEVVKCTDPYQDIKTKFNNVAMELYDDLKLRIKKSENPFETAVRISIAGNIIDFGVNAEVKEEHVKETIEDSLIRDIRFNTTEEMKEAVLNARKILFLGDNCGEIVFDKLLTQNMPREKITYVVKGKAIINDATMEDAVFVGMNDLVDVIDNGSDAPGTILKLCSQEFVEEFHKADLIIAKGQANYETLSYMEDKDIFFLLKAKCPVIAKDLQCDMGDIVLKRNSTFLVE